MKAKQAASITIECFGGPYDGHTFDMPEDLAQGLRHILVTQDDNVTAKYALVWIYDRAVPAVPRVRRISVYERQVE